MTPPTKPARVLRLALLLIPSAAAFAASSPIQFHDFRRDYPLPPNQSAIAVASADLNKDGVGDVLAVMQSGIGVLLSQKDTTAFSKMTVYPAGNQPVSIATGDFNEDGSVDVVTANNAGDDLTILFGASNGTLGPPVHISAGSGPVFVVTADFNGDGKLDLAVADFNGNNVALLIGNGDGTFQSPVFTAAGSQPTTLCLGDFNKDGHLDLAAISQTGAITVLLGNGKGGFTPTAASPSGAAITYSAVAADFNGDGILDLAVAEYQPSTTGALYVATGKGDGTFNAPSHIALPQYAPAVSAGDLNGDGHPDLIATLSNQTSTFINALAVLINDGAGQFAAPQLDGSPETPVSIAAVDLNHDGHTDVILGSLPDIYSGQAYVSVILGRGDGALTEVHEIPAPGAQFVAAGDVNGDSIPDLAVATSSGITVYLGNGKGEFAPQTPIPLSGGIYGLAIADVNGDGKPDIVGLLGEEEVAVLIGKGNGTFGKPAVYPGLLSIGFTVGDLNGDGFADVALAGALTNGVQILWGSASGALTPGPFLNSFYPADAVQAVAIGDFNGDGKADLALSSYGDNGDSYVEVFPGAGANSFGPEIDTVVPVQGAIVAADMNGDGIPDLVLSGVNILNIQTSTGVLLSNGDGTFKASTFRSSPYWTGAIAVADFNDDGFPDVIALPLSQQLVAFEGDGTGNLTPGRIYGAGAGAWMSLAAADFLNDRKPGLAFSNPLAGTFSIVEDTSK